MSTSKAKTDIKPASALFNKSSSTGKIDEVENEELKTNTSEKEVIVSEPNGTTMTRYRKETEMAPIRSYVAVTGTEESCGEKIEQEPKEKLHFCSSPSRIICCPTSCFYCCLPLCCCGLICDVVMEIICPCCYLKDDDSFETRKVSRARSFVMMVKMSCPCFRCFCPDRQNSRDYDIVAD